MKIHEYQAKAILAQFHVPVPRGEVAFTAEEAETAAKNVGGSVVVKAQIHAGGRGKGGGVKVAKDAAEAAVRQALNLSPADPWIQSLAGRIAFARGDYPLAVERQRAAVRQRPHFIEAHQQLAQAYGALGRKQEAASELAQVRTIRQGAPNASGDDAPPYLSRLFQGSLLKETSPREPGGMVRE